MSWQVLLFSLVVALLTGTLSGSASAFTQRDINKALKEGGDKVTASAGGQKRRQALLIVQFALAFVILTCAALISLSLYRLGNEDVGFDAQPGDRVEPRPQLHELHEPAAVPRLRQAPAG